MMKFSCNICRALAILFGLTIAVQPVFSKPNVGKLPGSYLDDDKAFLFDFSSGKVKPIKISDYSSEEDFNKAVSDIADLLYMHQRGESEGEFRYVSDRIGDLTNIEMKDLVGKDLTKFLKIADSIKVRVGTVLLLPTRQKKYVLLQVQKLGADGSITFQWLYRDDGKAVFEEIPFEAVEPSETDPFKLPTPTPKTALDNGQKAVAMRQVLIEDALRSLEANARALDKKPTRDLEKPISLLEFQSWEKKSASLDSLLFRLELHIGYDFHVLESLHAVTGAAVALDNLEIMDGYDSDKEKSTNFYLERMGRPASAVIVERLRNDKKMEKGMRQRLLDILKEIEGPAAEALLQNPPPAPPPAKETPAQPGLKIKMVKMPFLGNPDNPKGEPNSVLTFSTGKLADMPDGAELEKKGRELELFLEKMEKEEKKADFDEAKFDKEQMKLDQEYDDLLAREVGKKGDMALAGLGNLIIPSGRYARLGHGLLQSWNGKNLSALVRKQAPVASGLVLRETSPDTFVFVTFLIETKDKKYALVQIVDHGELTICFAYQPDGTAKFEVAPAPTAQEIASRQPEPTDKELNQFYVLGAHRGQCYRDSRKEAVKELTDLVSGEIKGGTLAEKGQALRLLGELREFKAAKLMIEHLTTSFPPVKGETQHPAVRALIDIQPESRPALLEAIGKAKDEKEKKVLIEALVAVEGKPAAEKLLEGIGKK